MFIVYKLNYLSRDQLPGTYMCIALSVQH